MPGWDCTFCTTTTIVPRAFFGEGRLSLIGAAVAVGVAVGNWDEGVLVGPGPDGVLVAGAVVGAAPVVAVAGGVVAVGVAVGELLPQET
jgi:hypothetical protein